MPGPGKKPASLKAVSGMRYKGATLNDLEKYIGYTGRLLSLQLRKPGIVAILSFHKREQKKFSLPIC